MAVLRLGAFASALSGKSGSTVFVQTAAGTQVRSRTIPNDPATQVQKATRMRLTKAAWAWSELDEEIIGRWESYAQSLARRDPYTGSWRAPRAMNVFIALYTKLLLLDPIAPFPESPPAQPFFGDNTSLTAVGVTGGIIFEAAAPNGAGITTELMIQGLASKNRKPNRDRYRSHGFHAFTPEAPTASVETPTGWFAAGYRFVNTGTGQSTDIIPAGKVLVETSVMKPARPIKKKKVKAA